MDSIFSKTSILTLTFDHVTSKSIGVIYSLGASTVPSLATFKQRSQEILIRQHIFKPQQFDLDLWPHDIKIYRGHLFPRGTHFTKLPSNFQTKGSKILSGHHLVYRLTKSELTRKYQCLKNIMHCCFADVVAKQPIINISGQNYVLVNFKSVCLVNAVWLIMSRGPKQPL